MRAIHIVHLDRPRPAVLLTREVMLQQLGNVTVAPVFTKVWGIRTEVPIGPRNGLDHDSVISCDNIQTVLDGAVGRLVGYLSETDEAHLRSAILHTFGMQVPPWP